jgi:shikimate 5-dehydrogenase/shikimate kinase
VSKYPTTAFASQLALSVFVENEDSLRQQLDLLSGVVATVELRLDNAPYDLPLSAIVEGYTQFTFILCNRAAPQTTYAVDPNERIYVDWPNDSELPDSLSEYKIIHSWHAHAVDTKYDLNEIAEQLVAVRRDGDLCKMVQWCDYVEDFELYANIDLCFAQGGAAQFSRIVSLINEAPFMYVCLPKLQTAIGQYDLQTALERFPNGIHSQTKLCGVVGDKHVLSSKSPQLWHAAMAESHPQQSFAYVPLPVNDREGFSEIVSACQFEALSITNPHKVWAESFANVASGIGAANFLLAHNDGYHAFATDGVGALQALANHSFTPDHKLLVIGNGGAALSVVAFALEHDIAVSVCARRPQLSDDWGCPSLALDQVQMADYDAFIQATTLGSEQQPGSMLPFAVFPENSLALDMVYRPLETEWLQRATADGAVAINGLEMLIEQFQAQFELFNARPPVVLIGMRGSGKSTLGQLLATEIGGQFLDIDDLLAQQYQRDIDAWISSDIEEFRSCEAEMLAAALQAPNSVIATGGGAVEAEEVREMLQQQSAVIWLRCPAAELLQRQRLAPRVALTDLPLAGEISALLDRRSAWYADCANFEVDSSISLAQSLEQARSFL